jgi:hypothetical protein
VIDFCDNRDIDFIFGLPGNPVLNRAVDIAADDIRTRRALAQAPLMRGYAETLCQAKSYQAKSWSGQVLSGQFLVRPSPGQAKSWSGQVLVRPSPGRRLDAPVHGSKRPHSASISVSW